MISVRTFAGYTLSQTPFIAENLAGLQPVLPTGPKPGIAK